MNIGNRMLAPTHDCAYFILAAIGLYSTLSQFVIKCAMSRNINNDWPISKCKAES